MEQTFQEVSQTLNELNKSFNGIVDDCKKLKKGILEVAQKASQIVLKKPSQQVEIDSSKLDQAIEKFSQILPELIKSHENIIREYEAFETPFMELTEKVQLLSVKKVLNSNVLSLSQIKGLVELLDYPQAKNWRLLYWGKRDGFGAKDFHKKCDFKANTLTIIKSTNGNIFGGYTDAQWDETGLTKKDPNAFIFSLVNEQNKPAKMKCLNGFGITGHSSCGPVFGQYSSSDIFITDNCNTNNNTSTLGSCFLPPTYLKAGTSEANSFLAGSPNFLIADIEVFKKD